LAYYRVTTKEILKNFDLSLDFESRIAYIYIMIQAKEIWKDVEGFGGYYLISNLGTVFSKKRNRILKGTINFYGYHKYWLRTVDNSYKIFSVHTLVALHFIENPLGYTEINHKDGNKLNNAVENLEWCSRSHNVKHAYDIGIKPRLIGEKNVRSKITSEIVNRIREDSLAMSVTNVSKKYNLSESYTLKIIKKRAWKHI
jgi:hypothetical protein